MEINNPHRKVLTAWLYLPGILMILLGIGIVLFPLFLPWVVAGAFILVGLLLIESIRTLRRWVKKVREQVQLSREQMIEDIPTDSLAYRAYSSWIN